MIIRLSFVAARSVLKAAALRNRLPIVAALLAGCAAAVAWGSPAQDVASGHTERTLGNAEAVYRPRKRGVVTFNRDIAPIVLAHCASCHRPGEAAPFPLLCYTDVKKHATDIVTLTERRAMPPWKADSHGEFDGENRLSADETGLIRQWLDEAAPEGAAADLPATPRFTQGWRLGPPDAELSPDREFSLGASGEDEFHTFIMPTNFPADRFLSAVDVQPGNRAIVHHTIVSVDVGGRLRAIAQETGRTDLARGIGTPSGVLDVWTPGKIPSCLPPGVGMMLPKGADVVIEIHYHRTGKPEKDRTKIGLYFCKDPVRQLLHVQGLNANRLSIAPGDADYHIQAQMPVVADITLRSVFPHMHRLGKSMTVTLTRPDGTRQPLVSVPDWDFNWQNTYRYREPVRLTRGSVVTMDAGFDNSAANPGNPNSPPKRVSWGERTTDEMGLVLFAFTVDSEQIHRSNDR